MKKIVLVRHGESTWNRENKFTGWTDVDLSEKGKEEALECGRLLKKEGFTFDVAYTSVLKRAIRTLWIIMDEMDLMWLPVYNSWRLNERHYGDLQGLNKSEMAARFGEEQILIWRRSFDIPPPSLNPEDPRNPKNDPRYKLLEPNEIPLTECLKDTVNRFLPYWFNFIVPSLNHGEKVIVVAHGNSLRALVQHLDNISETEIVKLNIPTGVPLIYELDDDLKPIRNYYLGNQEEINKKMEAVANQGKTKE